MSARALAAVAVACAAVLYKTLGSLPPQVASHFGGDGRANAFMPKPAYAALMVFMSLILPLLVAGLMGLTRLLPAALINIPHREHWLAPEREKETRAVIARHGAGFAGLLMAYLTFVQVLVARANRVSPPALENGPFIAGLLAFLAAVVVWVVLLLRRFRRPA